MSGKRQGGEHGFSLWPVVLTGVAGAAMFNLAPLFLQTSGVHFELDDRQIGWLMGTEIFGIALASVAMFFLMRLYRLSQTALIGLSVIVAGNLASPMIDTFGTFLVLRFLIGFFGDGLAYVTAIIALGRHPNSIRAFAVLSFSNMCVSGSALALLPLLPEELIRNSVTALLVIFGVVAIALWRHFPPHADSSGDNDTKPNPLRLPPSHLLALAGLFAFTVNLGAVWGYAERLGADIGLEVAVSAQLLSISIVFQAIGSLLAIYLSKRARPLRVLAIVAALQASGLLLQANAVGPWTYLAGFSLWGASWNLGIANFLGFLSKMARDNKALALAPGIEALGAAAGPVLVGSLLFTGTHRIVPLVAAAGAVVAVAIYLWIGMHGGAAPKKTAATSKHAG
jgi:MFS family permease